jgi:hypothetical protein
MLGNQPHRPLEHFSSPNLPVQKDIELVLRPQFFQARCAQNSSASRFSPTARTASVRAVDIAATKLDNVVPRLLNQFKRLNHPTAIKLVVWIKENQPGGLRLFYQSNSRVKCPAVDFSLN